ncbi:MAG: DUF3095 domain-containing protein [Leptolyngbyaceae cyanobacterium SM1_1_3]|nr:DUF3095 domain-containing protein [Leptolyngbyaceae cyanobacterium SM1_1_3]NJN01094.1 DUF3095 domain-containing protein [Leptolyngbyaceae cyanobacterium RM1_1_2]NJO10760.1 DUF3095 domain-containing protein [Leptolyngbyaceae cyanobacterium SL_1_1]
MATKTTENFYSLLQPLDQFIDLANQSNYVPVPDDWYIFITDIIGSTAAIEADKYKEVNFLGASSIIAVLNAVHNQEIPFIFGGDGASFIVSPSAYQLTRDALLSVRKLACEVFDMDLRVGVVPVAQIPLHSQVQVAKLRINSQYSQASFTGGGLTYATKLVKENRRYQLEITPETPPANLEGMECRWQDIPSQGGEIVSLIVSATLSGGKSRDSVYREVIQKIRLIYGDDKKYNPVTKSALKLSFGLRQLSTEIRARSSSVSFLHRGYYFLKVLIENLLGSCFMNLGLTVGRVHWGAYKEDVSAASDFQKIDDALQMVIAGTSAMTLQLNEYLEQQFKSGYLAYGLHISNRALITCLIFDQRDRHIHLIDGADGGYALAAKALKERLHRKSTNWRAYNQLLKQKKPKQ